MSILIKGMEMPTSCDGSCPLYDREFLRCNITYTEPWWGHDGEPIEDLIPIPSDCPLVPIPHHGRLIDADALMKKVLPKNNDAKFKCVPLKDLVNAPTIIPAEPPKEESDGLL